MTTQSGDRLLDRRSRLDGRRRDAQAGARNRSTRRVQKVAPMGDPIEIMVRGYELTLRVDDAKKIEVRAEEDAK